MATGAVILTYTPDTDSTAHVFGVSVMSTAGAADTAVVAVILVTGGVDILIGEIAFGLMDTTTGYQPFSITLNAGDVLELEVTTTDDTETSDVAIFAEEYHVT